MGSPPPSDNIFITDLPADIDDPTLQSVFGAYGSIKSCKLLPGQGKCSALIRFASQEEATWIVDNLNGNLAQGLSTPVQVRYANPQGVGKGAPAGGAWAPAGKDGKGGGDRWSPYGNGGGKGGDPWGAKGGGGGGGKGKGGGTIAVLKKGLQYAGVLPGGKWNNDENALFVGGLPPDTTDTDLYEIFSPFGAIPAAGVRAMTTPEGTCKGIGFVNFMDNASAQNAIATLNGTMMPDGTTLKVCIKGAPGARSGEKGDKGGKGK